MKFLASHWAFSEMSTALLWNFCSANTFTLTGTMHGAMQSPQSMCLKYGCDVQFWRFCILSCEMIQLPGMAFDCPDIILTQKQTLFVFLAIPCPHHPPLTLPNWPIGLARFRLGLIEGRSLHFGITELMHPRLNAHAIFNFRRLIFRLAQRGRKQECVG